MSIYPLSFRPITRAVLLVIVSLPLLLSTLMGAGTRLVSSDISSVVFEIDVPAIDIERREDGTVRFRIDGYGTFSPEGAAEIPGRTFLVAVPATGDVRVEWSIVSQEDLGILDLYRVPGKRLVEGEDGTALTEFFTADDPWDGQIRLEKVAGGKPSFMGRQRVFPVRVNPVFSVGDRFAVATKIRVIVVSTGVDRAEMVPVGEGIKISDGWKNLYDDLLVNPLDVERHALPVKSRRFVRSPFEAGKRLKIRIPETGLYSIRADSLIAAGLSPDLSNTGFALKKYYYDGTEPGLVRKVDIPIHIVKGGSSSPDIFSGDDLVIFHSYGIKDDVEAGDVYASHTDFNVIWLEEDIPGVLMAESTMPTGTGLSVTVFDATVIERKDTWYENNINAGTEDFYFLKEPVSAQAVMPFTLNDPEPLSTFDLTIRLMGLNKLILHQFLTFQLRNSSGTYDIGSDEVSGMNNEVYTFSGLSSGYLVDGENELLISSGTSWGFTVNDFTIDYSAGFASSDNMLEFTLKTTLPVQEMEVTGLDIDEGYVIDISDPYAPVFYDVPKGNFQDNTTSFSATLKFEVSSDSRFVFLGRGAGGHIQGDWISVADPVSLIAEGGPFDALVISHPDFLPPAETVLADYVAWREGMGFRTLTVNIEDIYDEFNGGLKSSEAIRRFIKYGFDNWGVEYVVLVGDGNEDHKQIFYDPSPLRGTPPDFIPPFTYSVDVIGSFYDDEVIATDKYYTYLDETWPESGYPDVFLGRLPVGSSIELRALMTKIRGYEGTEDDDGWRRNVVLFADDAWSDYPNYRFKSGELHFEQGMERIALAIEDALPGGFDVGRLFLSRWTDGAHEIGESGVAVFSEATDSARTYFTPYLLDRLNEGALFFSFQGHAHRAHLSSESGFSMFSQYRDLNQLTAARNFIFLGAGCHISQFALVSELGRLTDGPNGDCITEQMLFKSRSGAVGAYASSGFEVLDQNEYLFDTLHDHIFKTPPSDSIPPSRTGTGAHWVLGEMMTMAEIEHIGTTYYGFDQTFRYVLLGDPMLTIDAGPPNMAVEADWGDGWVTLDSDTLRSGNSSNVGRLRFTATDVVGLGGVKFEVDGEDLTGDMEITRLGDEALTWPRSWSAEIDYEVSLDDHSLLFSVLTPEGTEAGSIELKVETGVRLFHGSNIEIFPGGEAPSEGEFRIVIDLPVYLQEPPLLELDGIEFTGANLGVPDWADSTHWEGTFDAVFSGGSHTFSVYVGQHSVEFTFMISGSGLVVNSYNFPNPFNTGTNICYTLNFPADSGSIKIYNVSGRLIRILPVPSDMLEAADYGAPNVIYWDGRDMAGDRIANGSYIILLEMVKDGRDTRLQSISVKLE
ncbi:MAG: hypothetical protein KAV42_03880 [Candidatus Krumholzibacteria bacterium]|nr:hypothetical protein [Candidatus Krumholzibacteria bacterium]